MTLKNNYNILNYNYNLNINIYIKKNITILNITQVITFNLHYFFIFRNNII